MRSIKHPGALQKTGDFKKEIGLFSGVNVLVGIIILSRFLRSAEHKNAFGLCSDGMDNRRLNILDGRTLLCRIRGNDASCWRYVRLYE